MKDYLLIIINWDPILGPIHAIGAYRMGGQQEFADLRPFSHGEAFVGCDMHPALGVNRIEDVHCLEIRRNSIGTVMIFDSFEHVKNVHQATEQICRILNSGPMVIV